jgi:hypothetical protein
MQVRPMTTFSTLSVTASALSIFLSQSASAAPVIPRVLVPAVRVVPPVVAAGKPAGIAVFSAGFGGINRRPPDRVGTGHAVAAAGLVNALQPGLQDELQPDWLNSARISLRCGMNREVRRRNCRVWRSSSASHRQ